MSTLSQKSATVAENGETTATVAEFGDSLDLGVTWDFEIQLTLNFFNLLSNLVGICFFNSLQNFVTHFRLRPNWYDCDITQ